MTEIETIEKLKDPRFFIERFFFIVNKERVRVPFLFNPTQSEYYDNRSQLDLILKARKEGFSSLIEAMWLHACLFNQNTRAVVLSHELEATKRHFDRVRYFLSNMGTEDFKFVVDTDTESQRQLTFPGTNSSYFIGTAGSKAFGRGDDITHLHCSEVAHYENQDVLVGAFEACVTNAHIVLETTANGVGESFHDLWVRANDPASGSRWKPHFFAWHDDPTNTKEIPKGMKVPWTSTELQIKSTYGLTNEQLYWYKDKRDNSADPKKMPQEYPSNPEEAFLSSGSHVFNLFMLRKMEKLCEEPKWVGEIADDGHIVEFVENTEGRLKAWKMPRDGRKYIIAADIAEGVADGDYSVAQVLDRSSWEQVAVWRGHVDPASFGRILCDIGYFFNNAYLIPESNSIGLATIERIKSEGYPHLMMSTDVVSDERTPKPGFPTNEKTRSRLVTAIRNYIDKQSGWINDKVTIRELMTFVRKENGRLEAEVNHHDDCVISLAMGVYCLKTYSLDETYSVRHQEEKSFFTTSVVNLGRKSKNGDRFKTARR